MIGGLDELLIGDLDELMRPVEYEETTLSMTSSLSVPVYGALFQNRTGGTGYYYTSAQTINGADYDTAEQVLVPLEITRECDPRDARFGTSTLRLQLLDFDEVVTPIVASLVGMQCTFSMGEWGEDWSLAVTLFVGIVQEFTLTDNGYALTVASPVVLMDKTLFDSGKSKIVTGINSSATSVIIEDASNFQDTGYLLSGSERMSYATRTDNGPNWTLGGLMRGINSSTAATHATGDAIVELFILSGHPFDILEDVLSDDASLKTGLGMSDYVNSTNFATQKSLVGSTFEMFFEISNGENAKDWMEREILRPMGAYPYETTMGLVSLKVFGAVSTTSGSLADGDCLKRANWRGNFPKRVNRAIYLYDYDVVTNEFKTSFAYQSDGLIAQSGELPMVIESRGIRSTLTDTDDLLDQRSAAYIARFGLQLPTIDAEVKFSEFTLNVADDIATSFDRLVNLSEGVVGLSNAPAEIVVSKQDFTSKTMEFGFLSHPPLFEAFTPDGEYLPSSDDMGQSYTGGLVDTVA